jgi:hypothetical protein
LKLGWNIEDDTRKGGRGEERIERKEREKMRMRHGINCND